MTLAYSPPTWALRFSGWTRCDRVIELSVVEHLRPDIVVDNAADVLQKLAIDIF
jgi:hypothetical protein